MSFASSTLQEAHLQDQKGSSSTPWWASSTPWQACLLHHYRHISYTMTCMSFAPQQVPLLHRYRHISHTPWEWEAGLLHPAGTSFASQLVCLFHYNRHVFYIMTRTSSTPWQPDLLHHDRHIFYTMTGTSFILWETGLLHHNLHIFCTTAGISFILQISMYSTLQLVHLLQWWHACFSYHDRHVFY